jgi:hypothetical protein
LAGIKKDAFEKLREQKLLRGLRRETQVQDRERKVRRKKLGADREKLLGATCLRQQTPTVQCPTVGAWVRDGLLAKLLGWRLAKVTRFPPDDAM